jgi:CubicO group peptidase (beta-lactamase class C family)
MTSTPPTVRRLRRMAPAAIVAGLLTLALVPMAGAAAPPAATDPDFAAIDGFVEAERQAQGIPGVALGIVHDGEIVHLQGFGRADGSGRPVTPTSLFQVNSVAKSFTATAVMQLVERGKIEVDAPVQRYLPSFRVADATASAQITVGHLLTHTSGISSSSRLESDAAFSTDVTEEALGNAVASLRSEQLFSAPGAAYDYSNFGYATLGLVVQKVSGQPFDAYMREHIFNPLGMAQTRMFARGDEAPADAVAGHRFWFGVPVAADVPYPRGLRPAGGMLSSAADMSRFLAAYLAGGEYAGGRILSAASIEQIEAPYAPEGVRDASIGLGWHIGPANGMQVVQMNGDAPNFHANILLVPDESWGVVLLENAEPFVTKALVRDRRIDNMASGVASLLEGQQPPPPASGTALLVLYGALVGIVVVQVLGVSFSGRKLRAWQTGARRAASSRARRALDIGLPLVTNLLWAACVLFALPFALRMPIPFILLVMPDLALVLVASASVAVVWGVVRTVVAIRLSRGGGSNVLAPSIATS